MVAGCCGYSWIIVQNSLHSQLVHSVGLYKTPQSSTGVSAPPEIVFSAPLSTSVHLCPTRHCLIANWEQVAAEKHWAAQLCKGAQLSSTIVQGRDWLSRNRCLVGVQLWNHNSRSKLRNGCRRFSEVTSRPIVAILCLAFLAGRSMCSSAVIHYILTWTEIQ